LADRQHRTRDTELSGVVNQSSNRCDVRCVLVQRQGGAKFTDKRRDSHTVFAGSTFYSTRLSLLAQFVERNAPPPGLEETPMSNDRRRESISATAMDEITSRT
jgi:hypothetical protein